MDAVGAMQVIRTDAVGAMLAIRMAVAVDARSRPPHRDQARSLIRYVLFLTWNLIFGTTV